MFERKRLDKPLSAAVIPVLAWLVSVPTFVALIYAANQLDGPTILIALCAIGAIVSFLVGGFSTVLGFQGVRKYLRYENVEATLVVRTDRPNGQAGDNVMVSVSIDTEQRLSILAGSARLVHDDGEHEALLSQASLLPGGGQQLSPGERYESTVDLAFKDRTFVNSDHLYLVVSLQTLPDTDANIHMRLNWQPARPRNRPEESVKPASIEKAPASVEKAKEGARLFEAGDYEGAIAACTEAIEMDSDFMEAYRTRAEAYTRLGRSPHYFEHPELSREDDMRLHGERLSDHT